MGRELFVLFFMLLTQSIYAADLCRVIGVHQPDSNTYDGPTWCDTVKLNSLTVRGPLTLSQSVISGDTQVSGPVRVVHSVIQSLLVEDKFSQEYVRVSNSSVIKKDIIFKGKKGIVYVDASSKIQGKVINGDIHAQ